VPPLNRVAAAGGGGRGPRGRQSRKYIDLASEIAPARMLWWPRWPSQRRAGAQGLGHGDNSSVAWLIDPLISVAKVLSPWLPKTSL
jgi:hypothetical protein